MIAGWDKGTPLLVRTTDGGWVSATIERYDGECFYLVRVTERGHWQHGRALLVHQDDATRDDGLDAGAP